MPRKIVKRNCNNCNQEYEGGSTRRYCTYLCFRIRHEIVHANDITKNNYPSEYGTWVNMKSRCYWVKNKNYLLYGGRGIKVCEKWLGENGFKNFIADMGRKPSPGHSLDRFPNMDGNYEPSNCRWATSDCQQKNRRNNRWINHGGKNMIFADWARFFNVSAGSLHRSIKRHSFEYMYDFYNRKNNHLNPHPHIP